MTTHDVMTDPKFKPEISPLLVLSTAHLTQDTADRLSSGAETIPISIKSDEYGFFLSTIKAVETQSESHLPRDLYACLVWAKEQGCGYVLFDRDGPLVPDLTSYDW